jgi:hypothetical protein
MGYFLKSFIFIKKSSGPGGLFLPMIENCFKHGANRQIGKACVQVNLKVKEHELIFMVENSKAIKEADENSSPFAVPLDKISSIGTGFIKIGEKELPVGRHYKAI